MKTRIIILFLLLKVANAFTQELPNRNTVYLGIGGAGLAMSLNYERTLFIHNQHIILGRAGFGYFPLYVNNKLALGTTSAIFGASYLYGIKSNYIEIGVANTFAATLDNERHTYSKLNYVLIPSLGYRFQHFTKKSISLKLEYTPLISFDGIALKDKMVFIRHSAQLGIGYSF